MSRRPALFTEADLKRAGRVAERLGPSWDVLVHPNGAIRLTRVSEAPEKTENSGSFDAGREIML